MKNVKKYIKNFIKQEEGATTTEYVLLLALIVIAIWVVVKNFGSALKRKFSNVTEKLNNANG